MSAGVSGVEATLLALICCPKCGGGLEERPAALSCPACTRSWPVDKGVPLLVNEAKVPKPPKRRR